MEIKVFHNPRARSRPTTNVTIAKD